MCERERGREGGNESSIYWFIPQKPTAARAGSDSSQESRTQSGCQMWVTETQILNLSPPAFQGAHQQESGIEVEPGHKSRNSDMGCRCSKWHLNCCAKCPSLVAYYFIVWIYLTLLRHFSSFSFFLCYCYYYCSKHPWKAIFAYQKVPFLYFTNVSLKKLTPLQQVSLYNEKHI